MAESFNPRTRVGCDWTTTQSLKRQNKFQSTHPCGVRLYNRPDGGLLISFNPRTRVGCDQKSMSLLFILGLFQSTHPCGVRPNMFNVALTLDVSIHAPVWGAT